MESPLLMASVALGAVLAMMLVELRISRRNERLLRDSGAVEAPQDVYARMQWAYPGAFVAMALEGAIFGSGPGLSTLVGALLMVLSKAVKYWAVASLGHRWTFRVLVVPGSSLVAH